MRKRRRGRDKLEGRNEELMRGRGRKRRKGMRKIERTRKEKEIRTGKGERDMEG